MRKVMMFGVFFALAACHAETPKSASSPTAKHHDAGYQKPGAPVDIDYRWLQKPGVASAGKLELTVRSTVPGAMLEVELNTPTALQFANGAKQLQYQSQQTESPVLVRTLEVIPSGEGLHYLNGIVRATIDGETSGRAFAIAVQVGAVSKKAMQHPHLVEQQDGSKVIELPAEER